MKYKFFAFFIFIFLIFPFSVNAAIIINEISPSTDPEWVELYNDSDISQDLAGFLLEDGNSSQTDDLNLTGIIPGKGYLVFTHSEGWLNNAGDTLKLYNNASPSAIIDQHTFGNTNSTQSVARSPDGSENWITTNSVSNGSANPTPTSTPTPTVSPTATPTSSPTPTKTPTPVPTKSPTPKPTLSPTSEPQVLAESTTEPEITPMPESTIQPISTSKPPILAFVFIGIGLVLICVSILYTIKHARENTSSG